MCENEPCVISSNRKTFRISSSVRINGEIELFDQQESNNSSCVGFVDFRIIAKIEYWIKFENKFPTFYCYPYIYPDISYMN